MGQTVQSAQTTQPARAGTSAGALSLEQRALYVVGGLLLAVAGARPRPNKVLSVAAFGIGAYLAWRGAQGSDPLKAAITGTGGGATKRLTA